MSKIFDALESVRSQSPSRQGRTDLVAPLVTPLPARTDLMPAGSRVNMEAEMVRLQHHLAAMLPGEGTRVIQFIGSREGEGTSAVAREFARASATRFGQRVLLLEMRAERTPVFGADPVAADLGPRRVGNMSLYVGAVPEEILTVSGATAAHGRAATDIWEQLRAAYDLILVDSPPVTTAPSGLAVSSQVDGVILVVEAERTRWPVAASVKESIERGGGRLLGVVFNKRRHYIPAFIYRRL